MPILNPEPHVFPEDLLDSDQLQGIERRWWAVYTKARQEKALARDLYARAIPFYLPLVPRHQFIRGRRVESLLPLFSGYLFAFGDEAERVEVLRTNRVSQLIHVDDQPRLKRDLSQVQQLILRRVPVFVEPRIAVGQRVRVASGAFLGIEGVVQKQRAGYRLIVEVAFLKQSVSVQMDEAILEPISDVLLPPTKAKRTG